MNRGLIYMTVTHWEELLFINNTEKVTQLAQSFQTIFHQQLITLQSMASPQVRPLSLKMQKDAKQLLFSTLYEQYEQSPTITLLGDTGLLMPIFDLAWFPKDISLLLLPSKARQLLWQGMNCFQQSIIADETDIRETVELPHIFHHLCLEIPLPNVNLFIPNQDQAYLKTDYQLFILTDETYGEYTELLQRQDFTTLFVLNYCTAHQTVPMLANTLLLNSLEQLSEHAISLTKYSRFDYLQQMDQYFQQHDHVLQMLYLAEQKTNQTQLIEQRQKKDYTQLPLLGEMQQWTQLHNAFRTCCQLYDERTQQAFPLLTTTKHIHQVLSEYMQQKQQQLCVFHEHPFEQFVGIEPFIVPISPKASEQLFDMFQNQWEQLANSTNFTNQLFVQTIQEDSQEEAI